MPFGRRSRPWLREREGPAAAGRGRDRAAGPYRSEGHRPSRWEKERLPVKPAMTRDQVGDDERSEPGMTERYLNYGATAAGGASSAGGHVVRSGRP